MTVLINADPNTPQPSVLMEEYVPIETANTAIGGGMQRNRITRKKQATLTYSLTAPGQYQALDSYFATGSGVGYWNNQSAVTGGIFTFSGLPFTNDDAYVPGSSLYKNSFVVRIREQ